MAKLPYEIFQEAEAKRAKKEYENIENDKNLSPENLWKITDFNFYKWVENHYYLSLLNHFREKLPLFEIWQKTWKLNDKDLIKLGISNCISSHQDSKNLYRYIIESSSHQGIQIFVSLSNLDGKIKQGGPYFTKKYRKIGSFVSYIDWIKFQNVELNYPTKNDDLLGLATISSPNSSRVEVEILDNFRLLKMGGLIAPINLHGLLNVKSVEYVNLCNIEFTGRIATQNKEMLVSNSYVNNLVLKECEFDLVVFNKCKMNGINISNSKINSWKFIDCEVRGEIRQSELTNVTIIGGYFDVVFKDCKLYNTNARHSISKTYFGDAYKSLKQAYHDQGDDIKALEYYTKEKEFNRKLGIHFYKKNLKKNLTAKSKRTITGLYQKLYFIVKSQNQLIVYLFRSLDYYYWGYGRKPSYVIRSSAIIIMLFSFYYLLEFANFNFEQLSFAYIIESINISLSSFSTLGYFTRAVENINATILILESVIGGLTIGAFIASASNQKF